jgi:hypothetical protein
VQDRVEHRVEIWSAILSGCPSVTDSEVKRWRVAAAAAAAGDASSVGRMVVDIAVD